MPNTDVSLAKKLLERVEKIAHIGHWHLFPSQNNKVVWSDEIYEIFGWPRSDTSPDLDQIISSFHPDDRQEIQDKLEHSIKTGEDFEFELRLIRKGREVRYVHCYGECNIGKTGEIQELFGVFLDQTESKLHQKQLWDKEQQLLMALEGGEIGFWDWHIDTGEVTYSQEWAAMLGYEPSELKPDLSTWEQLCHPDDLKDTQKKLEDYFAGRIPEYQTEFRMKHKQGHWHWVLARGKIFERDEKGQPLRAVGTHSDIHERKQTEIALKDYEVRMRILEAAIDASAVGVSIADASKPDMPLEYVNEAFENMTGYKAHEVKGINCRFLQGEETNRDTVARIRQAIEEEQDFQCEIYNYRKDGTGFWNELYLSPVYNENQTLAAYIGYQSDITKRREAENVVKAQKTFLETVIENMPVGLFAKEVKDDFRFIVWNKKMEEIFGACSGDVIGKTDFDFFKDKLEANYYRQTDKNVFKSMEPTFIPEEMVTTPKGTITAETIKLPIFDEAGNPEILLGILTDISERKALERDLENQRLQAVQNSKLAVLGELSAGVAHEINNPLAIISGHAAVMMDYLKNGDTGSAQETVLKIENAVDRISTIVQGLKKFSRGAERDTHQKTDIQKIAEESQVMVKNSLSRHGVRLDVNIDPPDLSVMCNDIEIEQVLINLILNAKDAIKEFPEDKRWIRFQARSKNKNTVEIRITDSGPGIPADDLDNIFNPFFTKKPVGEGTGLGLSISHGIIQKHKGRIYVDQDMENTCFVIELPKVLDKG